MEPNNLEVFLGDYHNDQKHHKIVNLPVILAVDDVMMQLVIEGMYSKLKRYTGQLPGPSGYENLVILTGFLNKKTKWAFAVRASKKAVSGLVVELYNVAQ